MTTTRPAETAESLKLSEFLILSALWMLFGFMLWYYLSAFHAVPVRLAVDGILGQLLEGDFRRVVAEPSQRFLLQVETTIPFTFPDGDRQALGVVVNPLVYSYGLPLLFGLVMGSNGSWRRKLATLLVGYVAITLVQVWGVTWETLKTLAFNFGPEIADTVQSHGLSLTAIALCYQLGVLILPALVPVVVWVLSNRPLVEHFVGWDAPPRNR